MTLLLVLILIGAVALPGLMLVPPFLVIVTVAALNQHLVNRHHDPPTQKRL